MGLFCSIHCILGLVRYMSRIHHMKLVSYIQLTDTASIYYQVLFIKRIFVRWTAPVTGLFLKGCLFYCDTCLYIAFWTFTWKYFSNVENIFTKIFQFIVYFSLVHTQQARNRHWLPTNLVSLSHLSLFVFVKQVKKFQNKNWFIHSSISEGKQKRRGEMPLSKSISI